MPNKSRIAGGIIAVAVLGIISPPVVAHKGATGVVKERMELMKSMGKNMKALAAMMNGKAEFDVLQVLNSAKDIRQHAEKITSLFPKGSIGHPSEAKATIWRDWGKFQDNALRLEQYARALELSASNPTTPTEKRGSQSELPETPSPDQLTMMPPRVVFKYVADVCKSCHESFREKKK